jgi:enoyl-CoA hydratase
VQSVLTKPLPRYTARTIVDLAQLKAELQAVRLAGWAASRREWKDEMSSLGAPVRDAQGRLAGAIVISGPADRITPAAERRFVEAVMSAARGASGDLGFHALVEIATVMLHRPEKHNAISQAMRADLVASFAALADDASIGAVIVAGAGPVAFCAGTDVGEFRGRSGIEQWRRDVDPARIFEVIERFPKPVIAMIDGYTFGGGCELALACDLRICSDTSTFGQLEVNFDLMPGGGATQRLTRLVGRGHAMRFILSGDRLDAAEAHRIGLVEVLCTPQTLQATTMALAERIVAHDPVALELAKAAILSVDELSLSAGLRYEASLMGLVLSTARHESHIAKFVARTEETQHE